MGLPTSRSGFDAGPLIMTGIVALIVYGVLRSGTLNSDTAIYLACLVPSVILHEVSHGALANLYGDPTAKRAGRLTLNPIPHIDPIGTILLPGLLLLSGAGSAFGYAKPVPVNVAGMSRNRAMFVGLVGPATNIVIALVAALLINIIYNARHSLDFELYKWTITVLLTLGHVNVLLAVFNLLPIPPLDGSSVIERFLPARYMETYLNLRKYAMIFLLILVLAFSRVLAIVFDPTLRLWNQLLPS